ncbi:MAG: Crp/Fnr family transcriptional regulator [Aestuariivirgaceae bacterium]|nr:Crp/Fnr family transcriptional regulator [Aestuariivirgaceae bacterium]
MRVQTEIELLQQIPLFAGVDPSHLQLLSFSAKRRRFAAGQPILLKGETSRSAFLITGGRASAHSGIDSKSPKLANIEVGNLVGELSMFVAKPQPVSVFAVQDVEAREITRELFKRVSEEFPVFAKQVFAALSQKLDQGLSDLDQLQRQFD